MISLTIYILASKSGLFLLMKLEFKTMAIIVCNIVLTCVKDSECIANADSRYNRI